MIAGGLGSGARYLVGQWAVERLGASFPYGTLIVNLAGCFALGVVAQLPSSALESGAARGDCQSDFSAASRRIRVSTRKRWPCSRPAPPRSRLLNVAITLTAGWRRAGWGSSRLANSSRSPAHANPCGVSRRGGAAFSGADDRPARADASGTGRRVAPVGRSHSQLHGAIDRPCRVVARSRTTGAVEPSARSRPFGDSRRRGPALHDVSRRQRARQAGAMGSGRDGGRDGCRDRQDVVGAQVSVAP